MYLPSQLSGWKTNPCRLPAIAYSTYSQLPTYLTVRTFILNSLCSLWFPRWHRPTREDSTFWHGTTTWQIQNSHLSVHVIRFVPTAAATFQLHGTPVHQLGLFYLQRKKISDFFLTILKVGELNQDNFVF